VATAISTSDAKLRVLVVDDEKNIRTTLALCLEQFGCKVSAVGAADDALALMAQQSYDLAFLDLRLGTSNGLDLIAKFLAANGGLILVVMTAYATIDTAVEAIRRGASDYLAKRF
jgi:NtrC-family two-component system response regulator AlgB